VFASGGAIADGKVVSDPDDITSLDRSIFVSWQNGVGPNGEPAGSVTQSTVVQYASSGQVINSWQLTGRCDGLSADPAHDRLIATVNEDSNTSLYVINPNANRGSQLDHYTYSPNPPVHGGGTDAPHIYRGQLFISASNPGDTSRPAVYRAVLSGGTASLTPVFFDNSKATVANTNAPGRGTQVVLALTDPDSNFVVPDASPRFAGDFVLDSQGDGQQIYAQNAGTGAQHLFVLSLSSTESGAPGASTAVDDTVWATSSRGTLYATDGTNQVFAIRGLFVPGTAYSAVTPGSANSPSTMPSWLATLDLDTGVLTPVSGVTIQPKGLLFRRESGANDQGDNNDNQGQ
jgi:hypothetical protein